MTTPDRTARLLTVRPAVPADADVIRRVLVDSWGSGSVVSSGRLYDASSLPAFVAVDPAGEVVGLLTYDVPEHGDPATDGLLVVSLDAVQRRLGVGTALLDAAVAEARRRGRRRVWLTTSNELAEAHAFYRAYGMRLVEVRCDAMDAARQLKPAIPTHAADGTAIRDEWVLELEL